MEAHEALERCLFLPLWVILLLSKFSGPRLGHTHAPYSASNRLPGYLHGTDNVDLLVMVKDVKMDANKACIQEGKAFFL